MARLKTFLRRNFLRTKHKRPPRNAGKMLKKYEPEQK